MKQQSIVSDLVKSYHELGGLNQSNNSNLPSKRAVDTICRGLLSILFPGFFDEDPIEESELEMLTAERISDLSDKLCLEITKSLRFQDDEASCANASGSLCGRFFKELPEIRKLLKTDVEAAFEGDPAAQSLEEIILAYPFIEAVAIQRMAHVLYKESLPILPRMMTEWAHGRTGIDIHPGATIGTHFFIDHGTGVVVGETCRIGNHVKVYDGVTLGARSFPKDKDGKIVKGNKRHPDVEDFVTIYANATILGGETVIGENSTIGASAFIVEAVEPNSLVALGKLKHRIVKKSKRAAVPTKEKFKNLRPVKTNILHEGLTKPLQNTVGPSSVL